MLIPLAVGSAYVLASRSIATTEAIEAEEFEEERAVGVVVAGGKLIFEEGIGTIFTECEPIAIKKTFVRAFAKTAGVTMGSVTRFDLPANCTRGYVVRAQGLPWTVTYSSFAGMLPNITGLNYTFTNVRFLTEANVGGVQRDCQYEGDLTASWSFPKLLRIGASKSARINRIGQLGATRPEQCPAVLNINSEIVAPLPTFRRALPVRLL
jgi:hypothetical protein